MVPVEDKVIVMPDPVDEKAGPIIKPDTVKDLEAAAQQVATLIAHGPNAFEEWDDPVPQAGDIVYVTRFAGARNILGEDGQRYQIVCDKDVTAILTPGFRAIQAEDFRGTRRPLGVKNE